LVVTPAGESATTPGATVAGTVTDRQTDAPVGGVQVSIEAAEEGEQPVTTTTGIDGTYSVSGLPSGQYIVAFEPGESEYLGQYYDEAEGAGLASQVTLQAGSSVGHVDAALAESATVSGDVTAAKTGAAVKEATVFVQSAASGVVHTAITAEDGSYSVTGLPAGSYKVEFSAEGQGFLSQLYDGQPTIGAAQTLAIAAGETRAGINAALAGGATVSGTVTNAQSGDPVSGVEVFAEAIEGVAHQGARDALMEATRRWLASRR